MKMHVSTGSQNCKNISLKHDTANSFLQLTSAGECQLEACERLHDENDSRHDLCCLSRTTEGEFLLDNSPSTAELKN